MEGTVHSILDINGSSIGPGTPRAAVAANGLLDPMCSGDPGAFDLDGDCDVDGDDVRAAQALVVNGEMLISRAQEIANAAR
jgi:hypothetical protein